MADGNIPVELDNTSSVTAERLSILSDFISKTEKKFLEGQIDIPEQILLAKEQISKLIEHEERKNERKSETLSVEDEEFSNEFLEFFTTKAFSDELASLQEGNGMTGEDLEILAESIRSFGLVISKSERHLFQNT